MPVSCCSITWVTEFCTVSADAPGKLAPIFTEGGAMFGYCSIGSVEIERPPASMITIAITHAKTGRSMKNCEIATSAFRLELCLRHRRRRRPDRNSGAQIQCALHNQPVAVLEACRHQPVVPHGARNLDVAQFRLVVASDHPRSRFASGIAGDALLWREDRIRRHALG